MFEHLQIPYTFTIETSIGYFYDPHLLKTLPFGSKEWKTMGTAIAQGLTQFVIGF